MKIKILPNQNEKIELEAIEIHQKEMKGLTPADVELLFLQRASKLDTYGIDPYPVKDQKKNQFLLGINYSGIVCFEGNKKVNHFAWLVSFSFSSLLFSIQTIYNFEENFFRYLLKSVRIRSI